LGSPTFDEVAIKMPSGKKMVIKAKNNSKENVYVQSVSLNGKPYTKTYVDHATMMKGGVLEFVMGSKPNKQWGTTPDSWPASAN